MANKLGQQPIYLDTDMTTGFWETTGATGAGPIFVVNILLTCPGGTATAGTLTVTDAASTPINLMLIPVTSAMTTPALFAFNVPLQWRDFKVTGLTATGLAMQIWRR